MATYYWVGGAGTWDATTTTNWAASSGGAGGAGVPTSADNAVFDSASNATAYAVTVGTNAVALDITIAGPAAGNVTMTFGATAVANCYGSWTNAATGVVFSITSTPVLNFLSTSTGKTVTTNSVALGFLNVVFSGIGGGWTLGSAWTQSGTISVSNGSFNTGNYTVTSALISSTGTATRSITLGSSTLTFTNSSPWTAVSTGLTLNAGTSTINCTATGPIFNGGSLTYYNVNFASANPNAVSTITGSNTFNNLSQTTPSSGRRIVVTGASQTINGILTLGAANTYNQRVQLYNVNNGIPITFTVATIATLSDVDFRDITAAGISAPWFGTRLGNGLGNTNITFNAGKTVYWNLIAGGNWSATAWATSSGGTPATGNFPLAQDTAIVEDTGLTAGNTITVEAGWWMNTLNCTRTNSWTYAGAGGATFYGDFTIPSVTTITNTAGFVFQGQGRTQNLTNNGVAFSTGGITQNSVGGTLVLNGAVTTAATATVTLNNGTLNLNNNTLTCGIFSSNVATTRAIAFGTGQITLTGNATTIWNVLTATNFSYTGTGTVNCTYAGATGQRVIGHGSTNGTEANTPSFNVTAGTDNVAFNNNTRANNLNFTGWGAGGVGVLTFNTLIVYGNMTLATGSITGTAGTVIFDGASGTKTITNNGVTFNCNIRFDGAGVTWVLQDALKVEATKSMAIYNGMVQLKAGTTSTIGSLVTSGITMKYLRSTTPGVQATLSAASGTNTVTYLTITDIAATGGATWDATSATNVDGGDNTGWTFGAASGIISGIVTSFGFGFKI